MKQQIVVTDAGKRLDKLISEQLPELTRSAVQHLMQDGCVTISGKPVKKNTKAAAGDVITVELPEPKEVAIEPENIPLDIVYEDADIIVVNKPKGMVVHPAPGNWSGTLVNALMYHCGDSLSGINGEIRPGIVHRIDKDTSGLLAVAKNEESQLKLAKQFFDHSIERRYVAIVWGDIREDEGTIEGNIGRDPNDRMRFRVFEEEDKGKRAVTHYRVLERFGFVTLVECKLETGRTHQIRVHMSRLGHPIFNDERYGGNEIRKGTIYSKYRQFINNCFELCPRQALHAKTLGFVHPRTGEWLQFDSAVPEDMTALLDKWRKYCGQMPEE